LTQVTVGLRVSLPESEGFLVLGNGLVEQALAGQGPAEAVVEMGLVVLQPDGVSERGNGPVLQAARYQDRAEDVVCLGEIGLELEGLAAGGLGPRQPSL